MRSKEVRLADYRSNLAYWEAKLKESNAKDHLKMCRYQITSFKNMIKKLEEE